MIYLTISDKPLAAVEPDTRVISAKILENTEDLARLAAVRLIISWFEERLVICDGVHHEGCR